MPSSTEGGTFDLKHALSVAGRVQSIDEKVVALLHDAIEDGACSEVDILCAFPQDYICSAVAILTRVEGEAYVDYIERLANSGDELAIAVKQADLETNLARMDEEHQTLELRYRNALQRLAAREVRQ